MKTGKTTGELMKLLQEKHQVEIDVHKHQLDLLNMGYFHGYKGYRFIKEAENRIPYQKFDEVIAVYQFDTSLKACFYPPIMQIETALKNITLNSIIGFGSADFGYIFNNLLNDYEKHPPGSKDYKNKMKNRLELRNTIYRTISYHYRTNQTIIQHYVHQDKPVPLWAIFEVINFGEFGFFIHCLNKEARMKIAKALAIDSASHDQKVRVLEDIIFLLKELRNAVAHDGVLFDCRFKKHGSPTNRLVEFLQYETGIHSLEFDTIIDYAILHIYLLTKIGAAKKDIRRFIRLFILATERLRKELPEEIFTSIMGEEYDDKRVQLKLIEFERGVVKDETYFPRR